MTNHTYIAVVAVVAVVVTSIGIIIQSNCEVNLSRFNPPSSRAYNVYTIHRRSYIIIRHKYYEQNNPGLDKV